MNEKTSNLGKKRKVVTPYQKQVLVKRFQAKPYLERGEKHQLAESLNMSDESIVSWFDVRRRSTKRKRLLRKYMSNLQ